MTNNALAITVERDFCGFIFLDRLSVESESARLFRANRLRMVQTHQLILPRDDMCYLPCGCQGMMTNVRHASACRRDWQQLAMIVPGTFRVPNLNDKLKLIGHLVG